MSMKFWSLILMLISFVSPPLRAAEADEEKEQGFWTEARIDSSGATSTIGWYEKDVVDATGAMPAIGVYALVNAYGNVGYKQAYGGLYVKPLSWLQVGAGIGRENDAGTNSVRRNLFVAIDTKNFYSFVTYENGGSGPWHRVHAVYHLTDVWSVGAMNESFLGSGPRAEYHIKKNLTVWGALLHDHKGNTGILAVNYSF